DRAGIPARVLGVDRIGLVTNGPALDATPVAVNSAIIRHALSKRRVVVIPGFAGQDRNRQATLLGRGGSDLTAFFLARKWRACRCRLIKDVAGIYDRDSAVVGQGARYFRNLHWDALLAQGGRVAQTKAVRWARARKLPFEVAAANAYHRTLVGPRPCVFHRNVSPLAP